MMDRIYEVINERAIDPLINKALHEYVNSLKRKGPDTCISRLWQFKRELAAVLDELDKEKEFE